MADKCDDSSRWRESEAERLVASGRTDVETVRELLILDCHLSPIARRHLEGRLTSESFLKVLLGLAVEDSSGDAQMTASYWVSRSPVELLRRHVPELKAIAANEWDSVSLHARKAFELLRGEMPDLDSAPG